MADTQPKFTYVPAEVYIRSPCHRKHDAIYGYTDVNGKELLVYLGNKMSNKLTRSLVITCCSKQFLEEGCTACTNFLKEMPWTTEVAKTLTPAKPYKVGMQTGPDCYGPFTLQYGEIRLKDGDVAFVLLRDEDSVNLVGTATCGVCYETFTGGCDACAKLLYLGQKTWRCD